jgi:hypothetical protein
MKHNHFTYASASEREDWVQKTYANFVAKNPLVITAPLKTALITRLRIPELYNEFRFAPLDSWFMFLELETVRTTAPEFLFGLNKTGAIPCRMIYKNTIVSQINSAISYSAETDGYLMVIADFSNVTLISL